MTARSRCIPNGSAPMAFIRAPRATRLLPSSSRTPTAEFSQGLVVGRGIARRARLTGDRRDPHRAAGSDENRDQHLEDQSQRASWARWRENEGPGRRGGEELRRRCWEDDAWRRFRSKVEGERSAGAECTGICAERAELLEAMLDARDKRQ